MYITGSSEEIFDSALWLEKLVFLPLVSIISAVSQDDRRNTVRRKNSFPRAFSDGSSLKFPSILSYRVPWIRDSGTCKDSNALRLRRETFMVEFGGANEVCNCNPTWG